MAQKPDARKTLRLKLPDIQPPMSVNDAKERAERYVRNLKGILPRLDQSRVVDLANEYLSDAEYYLAKGDYLSSIVCSSYAEGLIDSLRELHLVSASWDTKAEKPKTVAVAGTWDIIHPGHVKLLELAASLGDLIVIVARDANVAKSKGHPPVLSELQRLEVVSSLKPVKRAVLGNVDGDPVKTVADLKPDYFVLGPDQPFDEKALEDRLSKYGSKTKVIKVKEKFAAPGFLTSTSKIVEKIRSTGQGSGADQRQRINLLSTNVNKFPHTPI